MYSQSKKKECNVTHFCSLKILLILKIEIVRSRGYTHLFPMFPYFGSSDFPHSYSTVAISEQILFSKWTWYYCRYRARPVVFLVCFLLWQCDFDYLPPHTYVIIFWCLCRFNSIIYCWELVFIVLCQFIYTIGTDCVLAWYHEGHCPHNAPSRIPFTMPPLQWWQYLKIEL